MRMTPQQPKEADAPLFWIALLCALGFILWAVLNLPSHKLEYQANPRQVEYNQETTLQPPLPADTEDENQIKKRDATEIASSDLAAQWMMADIAWLGLIIGGIGIGYIAWTLRETRSAAKSAAETLVQAKEATAIARETAAQEQRPWIFIERKVPCDFFLSTNGVRVFWRHKIQNIGKSPAYNVCFKQVIVRTERGFVMDGEVERVKETLINDVFGGLGSIIIPSQPNMEIGRRSSISTILSAVRGKGDRFHLITGVGYTNRGRTDMFYDVQAYSISPTNIFGPLAHELIHHQHKRQIN